MGKKVKLKMEHKKKPEPQLCECNMQLLNQHVRTCDMFILTDFLSLFSTRVMKVFHKMGIENLGQLAQTKETDLFFSENIGTKSISEIKRVLSQYGLRLGMFAFKGPEEEALAEKFRELIVWQRDK